MRKKRIRCHETPTRRGTEAEGYATIWLEPLPPHYSFRFALIQLRIEE